MGTDVEKVIIGLEDTHEVWASILQVAVAVWLLERQVSWACIVPVLLCLGTAVSQATVSRRQPANTLWDLKRASSAPFVWPAVLASYRNPGTKQFKKGST